MHRGRSRSSTHSIMANQGFGPLVIICGKRPKDEKYGLAKKTAETFLIDMSEDSNENKENQK